MEIEQIYEITTEGDEEGWTTRRLGYAIGSIEDIESFYSDRKFYTLKITPIKVVRATPKSIKDKKVFFEERQRLKERLVTLDEILQ